LSTDRRRPFIAAACAIASSIVVSIAVAMAVVIATAVLAPGPSGAQEGPATERDQVSGRQALVSVELDVLKAEDVEVTQALSDIRANVDAQTAALTSAQQALATANTALVSAEAAVADAQASIDDLMARTDVVVVQAFVSPPSESAFEILRADSTASANVRSAILDMQATTDAELLAQYHEQKIALDEAKAAKEEAVANAEAAQAEAEAALADQQAAISQQALFASEVQRRLDQKLSEAEMLADVDPALAEQLRAQQASLTEALNALDAEVQAQIAQQRAAELEALAEANKQAGVQAPPGGVVSVPCPGGGAIEIAGDLESQVARLLADAAEAGIVMCGNGYRDPQDQINVRIANCGSGYYNIWVRPASSCSPPTARPGASLHEQGLAIDFTVGGSTIGYGSAAYNWLTANAANYGLANLPGEAWHWSVNGE
jgi:septal ring factor EnvC (AmiA/AmiB activator)